MAQKLGRYAIFNCLEEIDAAIKNGTVDAARKYRGELEPAASLAIDAVEAAIRTLNDDVRARL